MARFGALAARTTVPPVKSQSTKQIHFRSFCPRPCLAFFESFAAFGTYLQVFDPGMPFVSGFAAIRAFASRPFMKATFAGNIHCF
jgi:hypothetical protein